MDPMANVPDRRAGARIRILRGVCDMTQRDLAKTLGLTIEELDRLERGMDHISPSLANELSRVLGFPADYFMEGWEPAGADGSSLP
jgi:transcriptional regulator with XRE-family HTH domain